MTKKPIRVRIAPSPTGYLHIGTARTALFNWLFAKKENGKFILRIEDTDLERSTPAFEKDILENLLWLGLKWNEGPYRQSERLDIYEKYIKKLLDGNLAYYCYCTEEELEAERQALLSQGLPPKYSGKCRSLSQEESEKRREKSKSAIIRFKVPEAEISFHDLIRGKITFDSSLIGDIAIAKNLRTPLYNFAVVVDDFEMKISHVIRGEDHIANTPKQILIQQALGFDRPIYAHLPLILNPDRSKMSKRYADTMINEYKKAGYLAEAMINFIALLGWHPATNKEIMSIEEIIGEFYIHRVQKAGAVFNIEKLNWINAHYIKVLDDKNLLDKLANFIKKEWFDKLAKERLLKIIALNKERMKKLSDFNELSDFFFELSEYPKEMLIWKLTPPQRIIENLKGILEILGATKNENFNKTDLEKNISPFVEERGRGEVLWPLRVALSGKDASPNPYEIMDILQKEETLQRIKIAIQKLAS
jgi:glutamyl-tRNA synthetase